MGIGLVGDYMHVSIDMSILAYNIVINYVISEITHTITSALPISLQAL